MDKRRMLIGLLILIAIPLYVWIQYYEIPNKAKMGDANLQQGPLTHNFTEVLRFENQYMGDASNLNGLFEALPLYQKKGPIELDTNALSVTVEYQTAASDLGTKAEQAVLYNSTAAFVLIGNLQQVDMRFSDTTFLVTRANAEKWFDHNLSELKKPETFKKEVQQPLQKEDLQQWLTVYTNVE